MNLEEGMVVADKFRLDRMIGRGGMGSVWKAHHLGLDVPCAVKFIEGELAKLQEAQQRFEREAKAAAQLRSPHVVQIYDYGVWQGTPYIAMELLEGQDLGKVLASSPDGRLSVGEVNRIVQQVCKALTKAHAAGIVHRDLKPDNVFIVSEDDGPGTVKILDFGVAKQSNAIDGSNTKTGAMLGTPYYMSPEQAQGIKSVDGKSDLWSLAVIVFQCITGRLPFESEALGDLLVKIIVSPIPVPSSLAPVPPGFDAWWLRVADRNPENRPANPRAFSESLMLALGQSAVTEVIDRSKLKVGGATALLTTPANLGSNVPNTPFPGSAPNAAPSTPNMYVGHQTPQSMGAQAHPSQPQGQVATGATFSGVEPPIVTPKKGVPVGVIAGVGALAVAGLALIGFVAVKGGKSQASGDTTPSSTAVTIAPSDTAPPKPAADTPPSVASATSTATATAAAASAEASASATAAAPTATVRTTTTRPAGPAVVAKPVAKPAGTTAAPAATTKKGYDPGF